MSERNLQRWSREVAEDPGAPAFLSLARAYRRQGQRESAVEVLLRGLERNPEHVDAHVLLGVLYVEAGDRERAGDEWQTALRLDPGNFAASRGLGFLALERGDLDAARRHLETAVAARPDDPTVAQARAVLVRRESAAAERRPGGDPASVFDSLTSESLFLGGLVLDAHGLVLAGRLDAPGGGGEELLGGVLGGAVEEARRAARLTKLGDWLGLLVEADGATLHVAPLGRGTVLIVAARPDAPAGWVARSAGRARSLAERFLEAVR
jgi:tetratricopeptide (TPR) repeat protein